MKPKPRREPVKRVKKDVIPLGPEAMITIGDTPLPKRLPTPPEYNLAESSYYMNNRETFINFIKLINIFTIIFITHNNFNNLLSI